MRTGRLTLLIVIAAVAAVAAFLLSRDEAVQRGDAAGEPLFEGLLDRVNDVDSVVVTGPNGSATLARDGDGWTVDVLGGYPADAGTVGQAVLGVARLTLLEPMTSRPEGHVKLNVHEPGSRPLDLDAEPDTTGPVRLELRDADGDTLADLIVGDARQGRPPAVYVRRVGEDAAWLAAGSLRPPALPVEWVDDSCVDIGPERFRRVTTTHPDGESVTVARATKADSEWGVLGVPAGRKESWAGVGRSVGGALQRLTFDDVTRADELDWPEDDVTLTRFVGFDGFVVEARTADVDGRKWTRFSASTEFTEPLPPEPDPAPAGEDEGAEAGDSDADASETDAAETDATETDHGAEDDDAGPDDGAEAESDTPADITAARTVGERDLEIARRDRLAAEAEAFSERHAPWAYALPEWKLTNLIKRMDDLTRAVDPAPAPAPDETPDETQQDATPDETPDATTDG